MKMPNWFFIFFVLSASKIFCEYDLDYFAKKHGTDKSSKHHNFTAIYEEYFAKLRYQEINLFEIGIAECCSALMWEEYFPNAHFYFIDGAYQHVDKGNRILSERSQCFICNQGDKELLKNLVEKIGVEFDVIVDDGGHVSSAQITSFETLFPYVKSGGVYIIEDLNYSYWKGSGGYGSKADPKSGPGSAIHYLKSLIDDLNYVAATDGCANIEYYPKHKREKLNYFREHIKAIHFYSSLCIIMKR